MNLKIFGLLIALTIATIFGGILHEGFHVINEYIRGGSITKIDWQMGEFGPQLALYQSIGPGNLLYVEELIACSISLLIFILTLSYFFKDRSWTFIKVFGTVFIVSMIWSGYVYAFWEVDNTINANLPDVGVNSKPSIFFLDGTLYMISGEGGGTFPAFNWTGTAWQPDSGINTSLPDIGDNSAPYVFYNDGTLYLISGEANGNFPSFNWTGTAWQSDSGINTSLPDVGVNSIPTIFFKDGTLYLIAGDSSAGLFRGFNWTGSAWQPDSNINASLSPISRSLPTIFFKDGTWYMISGRSGGLTFGYNWTGSAWQSDNDIISGITVVSGRLRAGIFQMDGELYLIAGSSEGIFDGHIWNENTTPATPTLNSPPDGFTTTNTSVTLNATTTDSDMCFYWYNNSNLITPCDEPVNSSNLVGAWHFNEGNGNSWISNENVSDYSGNGNDGEIFGAEYVRGRYEKGLQFDGVNDYVNISTDSSLTPETNDFSACFWAYQRNDTGNEAVLRYYDGISALYYIIDTTLPTISFSINDGSGPIVVSGGGWSYNAWHFACVVADRDANATIYVDGVEVGTGDISSKNASITGEPLQIGRHVQYFNGTIDEPRIYNRSLSSLEILAEYNKGFGTHLIPDSETFYIWTAQASDSYTNSSLATAYNLTIDYTNINLYELTTADHITENLTIRMRTGNFSTIVSEDGNSVTFQNIDRYIGTVIIVDASNTTSSYFPTQVISDSYLAGEDFNLYHVADTDNYALNTLKLQDLIGTFTNAQFEAWAYIGDVLTPIYVDIFDIEDKVTAYFNRDTRYTIYIQNDFETRNIGFYVPDIQGSTKIVTVGDVAFTPDATRMLDTVTFEYADTNDSIVFSWLDISNGTGYVEFYVFNNTNLSQQIYFANCTNSSLCSFSYTVANVNLTYSSVFLTYGTNWGHSPFRKMTPHEFLTGYGSYRLDLELPQDKEIWYPAFSMAVVIMLSMLFTRRHAGLGGVSSMGAGVFFAYVGWLPLPGLVISVMLVMAVAHAIRKREEVR